MEHVLQQEKTSSQRVPSISAKLRQGHAIIRPVSQVNLRLRAIPGRDRFAETIDKVLPWLKERAGRALPREALQRESFELSEIGAQRTAAIALQSPRYWTARLDYACEEVASRTWITEIGIGVSDDENVLFGTRLICATRGPDAPMERTIPRFVKAVLGCGPAELDGIELPPTPRLLSTESDILGLVDLLEQPDRQSDIVVFALPEGSSNPHETLIPYGGIYKKLQAVAHVFIISSPASYFLTDVVGRELSVFRHAVRIYRPGFTSWIAQPCNHPLILPGRIKAWNGGTESFGRWITDQILSGTVRGRSREERLPSFNSVRQMAAAIERQQLRDAGGTDAQMLKLYEEDNEKLRGELKELDDIHVQTVETLTAERDSAIQEANIAKAHSMQRAHRLRQLEAKIATLEGRRDIPIPTSLEDFEEWCKEHLSGVVEVMGRAFQAVRKSGFDDPQFIYQSLLILKNYYAPMRIERTPESRAAYQKALHELQLEDSPTGDAINYAAETYSVQYGGVRRPLDRHLKGSNCRDRRIGFRLYYFWDEEDQVVVVGWLPTHLDSRLT